MYIYIASPYTDGDVGLNVRAQMEAANALMNLGHTPYVPLLSHFQHIAFPRPYEEWVKHDIQWINKCDAVLRLPGISKGADIEVDCAQILLKKIYYSIEEIIKNT